MSNKITSLKVMRSSAQTALTYIKGVLSTKELGK